MNLHSRIAPALPSALAIDALPPPARRRRMRPKRWQVWALAISFLLHLLALFIIFYNPHSDDDQSPANAPAEWQIEMQPDRSPAAPPPSSQSPNPTPTPAPPQPSKTVTPTPPQPQPQQAPPPPPPQATQQTALPVPTSAPPVLSSRNALETTPQKPAIPKPTPKPNPSPFANLQESKDFFLPRTTPPPSDEAPTKTERGGLNLALGRIERYDMAQPNRRATDLDADVQVSGADIGPDWMRDLHIWWIDHRRYPQEAVRNLEQGDVVIRFDVDRSGLTSHAEILQHSPSQWLDAQTMATFGHAHLPPLPPSSKEDHKTVTITVRYILQGSR